MYIVNVEAALLRDDHYLLIVRGAEETHAAGLLSLVGGKVETRSPAEDVLEDALRREILEEVGLHVGEVLYVYSSYFTSDDGDAVVDVVFLCRYAAGTPAIHDYGEVAAILWLTAADIMQHPHVPPWTKRAVERAEVVRQRAGW